MKTKITSLFFLGLLGLLFTAATPAPVATCDDCDQPPGWELLGKRIVNFGLDHDEILVTAAEGRFTAIKLKLKGGPINMIKCVVHYGNGTSDEIELRAVIPANGESRIIDLQGGDRVINRVSFWYDTKNRAARRAIVEVWGRH